MRRAFLCFRQARKKISKECDDKTDMILRSPDSAVSAFSGTIHGQGLRAADWSLVGLGPSCEKCLPHSGHVGPDCFVLGKVECKSGKTSEKRQLKTP